MGTQSQAPQQHAQARPMAVTQNHQPAAGSNGLMGSGGVGRFNSLARQTSIYSLTLDEFQNAVTESGKNFGSMNMDEFLKDIWTVAESQAMASAMAGAGSGGSSEDANATPPTGGGLVRQSSLARQPSLALPRTLSRKTVDEVWRDIQLNSESRGAGDGGGGGARQPQQQRTTTFGEMTLEDFLVKAGVVREEGEQANPQAFLPFTAYGGNTTNGTSDRGERSLAPTLSLSPANALTSQTAMEIDAYKQGHAQQQDWLRTIQQQQQHMLHVQAEAYGNAMSKRAGNGGMVPTMGANGGYAGMANAVAPGLRQMGVLGGLGMDLGAGAMGLALAPGSPVSTASDGIMQSPHNGPSPTAIGSYGVDGSFRGKRRGDDGAVEKVVERRQRRMIKNRESAARSRARKQAYTVELEAEVTQLKEENKILRKQKEEEAMRSKKLVLEMKRSVGHEKHRTLRRTRTGPW